MAPVNSIPACLDPALAATRTPTPTPSSSPTPTSTRTVTPTPTKRPTATPQYTLANVFFVDKNRFNDGVPPYEVAGVRWVLSNNVPANVLTEFFNGPGADREIYLWLDRDLQRDNRLQQARGNRWHRPRLSQGQCNSQGATYTIANLLRVNLKQFSLHSVRENL